LWIAAALVGVALVVANAGALGISLPRGIGWPAVLGTEGSGAAQPTITSAAPATPGPASTAVAAAAPPATATPRAAQAKPTTVPEARPTAAATATVPAPKPTATGGTRPAEGTRPDAVAETAGAARAAANATVAPSPKPGGQVATGGANVPGGQAETAGAAGAAATAAATAPVPTRQPTAQPSATPRAAASGGGQTIARASGSAGVVTLTFDAGADRGYTEDILDTLADEHIPAAFGITGVWARQNPDLVRRMAADGHLIINHTRDHKSFTGVSDSSNGLTAAQRRTELEDADAIIAPLIGHSTKPFYRLPYGDDDARVAADVAAAGYTRKAGWTLDSWGWRGLRAQDIVARCMAGAAPGAVYIFHVGQASQDAGALPAVIRELRDRGYGFERFDQL
jgi:peptidoglycan/xylan/chitin deacetylase (PgdA/CDA1 family)